MLHPRTPTPPLPTTWVDMRRVLADLPAALCRRIASLGAVHAALRDQVTAGVHRDLARMPAALRGQGPVHPLVCRHPRTGVPFLFLPVRRDSLIPEMTDAAAYALLCELWDAVVASPHRISMPVGQGEVVIWDNLAMTHDKPAYPAGEAREVWFLTLGGAPLQPAEAGDGS
jgi:taurine dioxygenase